MAMGGVEGEVQAASMILKYVCVPIVEEVHPDGPCSGGGDAPMLAETSPKVAPEQSGKPDAPADVKARNEMEEDEQLVTETPKPYGVQ